MGHFNLHDRRDLSDHNAGGAGDQPSHFNHVTAFDGAVFSVMGAMIGLNTLLVV
jgi:hypothetical protein